MIGQDIPRNNPMPLRIAYRRVLWIFAYGLFTTSLFVVHCVAEGALFVVHCVAEGAKSF